VLYGAVRAKLYPGPEQSWVLQLELWLASSDWHLVIRVRWSWAKSGQPES